MDVSPRIRDTSAQDIAIAAGHDHGARRLRWLAGGVALLLTAATGWMITGWAASERSVDASALRIAAVREGDLVRDLSADGRVIAANSPTLHAVAAGIVHLDVVAGDRVERGQRLGIVDSPELRSRLSQEASTLALAQADAQRAEIDARIAALDARKAFDQAVVDHTSAKRDLERYRRAYEGGAVSRSEVTQAMDALEKARIGLSAAQDDDRLQQQAARLDARNKALLAERQQLVVADLRRQVEALTVRAPFDGIVGQVHATQGATLGANAPILSVVDLHHLEVEIRVPESLARDLAVGMGATIAGGGRRHPAQVSAVSPEVVKGEVVARIRFLRDAMPKDLRQNQHLTARIVLGTRRGVLKVERGPFVETGGGRHAYVVRDGIAVRRRIALGASSLGEVEIVSGLNAGDQVVVSGADRFDGMDRVRVTDP